MKRINKITSENVYKISEIKLVGPQIHHSWYNHLKTPSGETDLLAISLLARIVSKYQFVVNKETGVMKQKFTGETYSESVADTALTLGFSIDQTRLALERLQKFGLLSLRPKHDEPGKHWIEPHADAIRSITHDARRGASAPLPQSDNDITPRLATASLPSERQPDTTSTPATIPSTTASDRAAHEKTKEFLRWWNVCLELSNHPQTIVRRGDIIAVSKYFTQHPTFEVREVMAAVIEAWYASHSRRPARNKFDPFFHCRKSLFMGFYFQYEENILHELDYDYHDEPIYVTDILKRAEARLMTEVKA